MNEPTNRPDMEEVDRLIEEFLIENPQPETGDWKRLIEEYPQHAGATADAVLINRNFVAPQTNVSAGAFNEKLFNVTISQVLNLVHQTPGASLVEAKKRVTTIQGPSVKKIAEEIGIGPYASLLNGVLVGRTIAPIRVLRALESRLEVPILALVELFRLTFSQREVPAHKVIGGKPKLQSQPCTWEQAVKEMNLPPDETARLLSLCEED